MSRHGPARPRRLLPRPPDARPAFRRALVRGDHLHRHLLPAGLPGAHRQARELPLLRLGRGRPGGRLPSLLALPARDGSRPGLLARDLQHRVPRAGPDRRRRAGRRRGGRGSAGRAVGPGRAPAPAPVPAAPRRVPRRRRPDPARPLRQAAHPGDAHADDGGGAGRRLRQRPPVQRDVPRAFRPSAQRASSQARCAVRGGPGRRHRPAALPSALRLAGHARPPGRAGRGWRGGSGRRRLPAHRAPRGAPGHGGGAARAGPRQPGRRRALPLRARSARDPGPRAARLRRGRGHRDDRGPPLAGPAAGPAGRAAAGAARARVDGTASSWRCARSSASR